MPRDVCSPSRGTCRPSPTRRGLLCAHGACSAGQCRAGPARPAGASWSTHTPQAFPSRHGDVRRTCRLSFWPSDGSGRPSRRSWARPGEGQVDRPAGPAVSAWRAEAGSARATHARWTGRDGEGPSLRVIDGRRGPRDAWMASRRIRQRSQAAPCGRASRFVRAVAARALRLCPRANRRVWRGLPVNFAARAAARLICSPEPRPLARTGSSSARLRIGRPSGSSTRFRTRPLRSMAADR
jgi:hypothetical protein